MMGAKPRFLSLSFIIEEGFEFASLEKILASMAAELAKNGAHVVTGDTKVVPRGSCDGIFINTTGIGESYMAGLSSRTFREGDAIIVSGEIGGHGAAIFAGREGISSEGFLESDCRSLWPLVEILISNNINIRTLSSQSGWTLHARPAAALGRRLLMAKKCCSCVLRWRDRGRIVLDVEC